MYIELYKFIRDNIILHVHNKNNPCTSIKTHVQRLLARINSCIFKVHDVP